MARATLAKNLKRDLAILNFYRKEGRRKKNK